MPRPSALLPPTPIGMRLITSTPQARATSTTPLPTSAVARLVACWLLPHCVSTVVAAVVRGRPALSQAVRVMLNACSPTWLTQPPTTWSISAGSMPVRSMMAFWTVAEHLGGVQGGQAAVALADGRADGVDDDDVAHGGSLRWRPCPAFNPAHPSRSDRRHASTATSTSSARRCSSTTGRATTAGRCTSWACSAIRRAGASTCRTAKTRRTARPLDLYSLLRPRRRGRVARRRPAVQLAEWARTHRFCGRCGTATEQLDRRAGDEVPGVLVCSPSRAWRRR